MRNNLYENGDFVRTPDGNGFIDENQKKQELTVLVNLIEEDKTQVYDIDDVELITSIS